MLFVFMKHHRHIMLSPKRHGAVDINCPAHADQLVSPQNAAHGTFRAGAATGVHRTTT
jgi:hypothetical protein